MFYNNKTLILILSFYLIFFSCAQEKLHFINVINLNNSPDSPKDEGLNVFFDLGSWMGFSLSDKETNTGFSGPYILGLEHGIWSSNNFTSIDLISENGNSLLTNLNYSEQKYFPGKLENQLHFEDIELISNLIFTSDKSAIISSKIINNGTQNLNFAPQWKGEIFDEIGSLINNDTVLITLLDKNQKIFLRPINTNELNILTDSNKYVINLNNIILKPKESKTYTIEIQYHPDQRSIKKNTNRINVTQTIKDNHLRWEKYLEITKDKSLSKEEKLILTKSICTLINNWRSAAGALKHDGLFPSYHYKWFQGFWSWDSWKHAVALVKIDKDLAKNQVRAMYDYQNMDGMIADCIFRDTTTERHNWRDTKPPLSSWAIWEIFKETNDTIFLKEMYPKLVKYHNWWYTFRDYDKDGLCEYGSTDGSLIAAKWESGMDNAIRFDNCKIVSGSNYSINTESVDLNSYLSKEKEYLSKMAKVLSLPEYNKWEQEFNILRDRIQNDFYDEKSGYFYDIDAETGEFLNDALGPEGWTPIWCEIATKKQAEKVIEYMMDTNRFNTTVPLPTIDVSHPKFDPKNGYWRGPVWIDQLWFGVDGLYKYDYDKEANLLKNKVLNNCEGLNKKGISIRENYHPLTGEGLNAEHFSWSAAHLILLITE
jgi:putative isomerase